MTSSAHINLRWQRKVRQRFDRAASQYHDLAQAQHRSADDLLALLLQQSLADPTRLADIGCGTGYLLQQLVASNNASFTSHIAIDISPAMLTSAGLLHQRITRLCADVLALPIRSNSLDVVISNFALHWSLQPQAAMQELARVLQADGLAILAIPVQGSLPGRLAESQQGEPLQALARWQAAAELAGFCISHQQQLHYVDYFPDADTWLSAVRHMGVTARDQAANHLRGASYLNALKFRLEQERQAQGIPLRYQVWQCVLRVNKPS
jgi:malonyl-CoA O-methyltransferase